MPLLFCPILCWQHNQGTAEEAAADAAAGKHFTQEVVQRFMSE